MSLKDALFSDSQAKVFIWIFGQPQRAYHLSELRRLTGLGSASLQREVNRLADAGLIHSKIVGNQRLLSANCDTSVFNELQDLTRKVLGAEPLIRQALEPITKKIDVALLYGSFAKQSDTAESDIDIMLVGRDLALGEILEQLIPLEEVLGRKINPTCYTTQEFMPRLSDVDSFVRRVLDQPVINLIGDIDAFRRSQ
jgi:predicted nucleotidyltransferase